MFFVGPATADDTITADSWISLGFCTATEEGCTNVQREDASDPSDVRSSLTAARVMTGQDLTGAAGEDWGMSFDSFHTDGVRIIVDDQSPTAFLGTCVLIGGTDVSDVCVGTHDDLGNGTSAVDITAPGFEPDLVFFSTTGNNDAPESWVQKSGNSSFGIAHNGGNQRVNYVWTAHNAGFGDNSNSNVNNTVGTGATTGTGTEWAGTIGAFDASGFSVTPSAGSGFDCLQYFALKFTNSPDIAVIDTSYPTAGNYAETAPGFTPNFGLIHSIMGPTARATDTDATHYAQSIVVFDETTINGLTAANEDGAEPTVCKFRHNTKLKLLEDDGATLNVEASGYAFDSLGWDFTLTTNPTTNPVLGWGLAIGAAAGSAITIEVPSGGTPY